LAAEPSTSSGSPRSVSRRHHIVPAFYLASFTDSGLRDGYVTVTNFERYRIHRGRPDAVGFRNNYNTLESEDADPDGLEQAFADVEASAAPALKRIVSGESSLEGDDLSAVLPLLAIQVARSPAHRNSIMHFTSDISQRMLEMVTANPGVFASYAERMRKQGVELGDFDSMHHHVRESQVRIRDNDWVKAMSIESLEVVVDSLGSRNWGLLTVSPESPFRFLTSDHPLKLKWTDPELVAGPYPPGFAMASTRVTFPLAPTAMLVGEFDVPTGLRMEIDEAMAARLNTLTIIGSRELYSVDEDFVWGEGESVRRGANQLLDAVRAHRQG
jgi:hypothetical protein